MTDDAPSTAYWREVRISGAAGLLLVAHFALANAAAWNKCAMFDEGTHIASGFAARRTGDFRILPLAISQQLWMTLPLEWMQARAPGTDQRAWRQGDNWACGRQLLFEVGIKEALLHPGYLRQAPSLATGKRGRGHGQAHLPMHGGCGGGEVVDYSGSPNV